MSKPITTHPGDTVLLLVTFHGESAPVSKNDGHDGTFRAVGYGTETIGSGPTVGMWEELNVARHSSYSVNVTFPVPSYFTLTLLDLTGVIGYAGYDGHGAGSGKNATATCRMIGNSAPRYAGEISIIAVSVGGATTAQATPSSTLLAISRSTGVLNTGLAGYEQSSPLGTMAMTLNLSSASNWASACASFQSAPPTNPIAVGQPTSVTNMSSFWGADCEFRNYATPPALRTLTNETPLLNFRCEAAEGDLTNWSSNVTWTPGATGGIPGLDIYNITSDWEFCQEVARCQLTVTLPGETDSPGDVAASMAFLVKHGIEPAYYAIGNEPNVWTHWGIPWADWKTSDNSTPSPMEYAQEVANMIPIVRSYVPNAKILGIENFECANDTWIQSVTQVDYGDIAAVACHSTPAAWKENLPSSQLVRFYSNLAIQSGRSAFTAVTQAREAIDTGCLRAGASTACRATPLYVDELSAVNDGGAGANSNYLGYISSYPGFLWLAGSYMYDIAAGAQRALQYQYYSPNYPWGNYYNAVRGPTPKATPLPVFDFYSYYAPNITLGQSTIYQTTLVPNVEPVFAQALSNSTQRSLLIINANTTTSDTVTLPSWIMQAGAPVVVIEWNNSTSHPTVATYPSGLLNDLMTLAPQSLVLVNDYLTPVSSGSPSLGAVRAQLPGEPSFTVSVRADRSLGAPVAAVVDGGGAVTQLETGWTAWMRALPVMALLRAPPRQGLEGLNPPLR